MCLLCILIELTIDGQEENLSSENTHRCAIQWKCVLILLSIHTSLLVIKLFSTVERLVPVRSVRNRFSVINRTAALPHTGRSLFSSHSTGHYDVCSLFHRSSWFSDHYRRWVTSRCRRMNSSSDTIREHSIDPMGWKTGVSFFLFSLNHLTVVTVLSPSVVAFSEMTKVNHQRSQSGDALVVHFRGHMYTHKILPLPGRPKSRTSPGWWGFYSFVVERDLKMMMSIQGRVSAYHSIDFNWCGIGERDRNIVRKAWRRSDEKDKFWLVLHAMERIDSFSPNSQKSQALDFILSTQRMIWRDHALNFWNWRRNHWNSLARNCWFSSERCSVDSRIQKGLWRIWMKQAIDARTRMRFVRDYSRCSFVIRFWRRSAITTRIAVLTHFSFDKSMPVLEWHVFSFEFLVSCASSTSI